MKPAFRPGPSLSASAIIRKCSHDCWVRNLRSKSFDVCAGVFPDRSQDHSGYLITGSPAGAYEPWPFIPPLEEFIRASGDRKMVGICFGHQIMAQALGGRVEKSNKGWGAGLHHYEVVRSEPWTDSAQSITVPASHQDQVVVQPPRSEIVVASDFTPIAGLAWTNRPAISFQFHPEFSAEFAKALIKERFDDVTDPETAMESLDAPNDNVRVGGWIRRFLGA